MYYNKTGNLLEQIFKKVEPMRVGHHLNVMNSGMERKWGKWGIEWKSGNGEA